MPEHISAPLIGVQLVHRVRLLLFLVCSIAVWLCAPQSSSAAERGAPEKPAMPNFVLIVADDMGFGDLGVNGSELIATPHIDDLARRGVNLTTFYSSANVCTPSRAGLLTGRYPIRTGLAWEVIGERDERGLPATETTIAELLGAHGYVSAIVGKWHLGHQPQYWPTEHGFDEFYGLLYSNDMRPLALYSGRDKVEEPVDQSSLTRRYTDEAIRFVESNRSRPFFLYLPHTFPHIPLFVSEEFEGKSSAGLYGDTIEEIDWSTGQIVAALKRAGIYENTVVMFTSDNGAWFEGSGGSLRGGKGSTWDGAFRVPFIASWPARLPAGKSADAMAMNIDILPTIAAAAQIELPAVPIDGRNLLPLLRDATVQVHDYLYFFNNEEVIGVSDGRWRLLTHVYYRRSLGALDRFSRLDGFEQDYPLLFDMNVERPERYSVAREHPRIAKRLYDQLTEARESFDALRTHAPMKTYPE